MSAGENDARFMKQALALAARGRGMVHPNPMVGAVVVKDGKVLGKGYHRGPHTSHAEVVALVEAGEAAEGGDMYVTLEPCNHHGRTPPCTEAIMKSGIKRVVIAAPDTNPHVSGGGAERLASSGLIVESGLLEAEARELNAAYEMLVLSGRPLVTLKVAATADGRVAARGGASRWITGEEARKAVHRMRRESDAVMVGRGTVEADDPELTVRMVKLSGARPPLRIVVDSRLSMDEGRKLAAGGEPRVIVATTAAHDPGKAERLRGRGVEVMVLGEKDGRVNLEELLEALGKMEVAHLLVEGGPVLAGSMLEMGLVDRLAIFMAPKVFGDEKSRSWVEGRTVVDPAAALPLQWRRVRRLGDDLLLEAETGKRV